jgi:hypothetical protein
VKEVLGAGGAWAWREIADDKRWRKCSVGEADAGGAPLLQCGSRKKGSGGLSGAKWPNRQVGWLG